MIKFHCEKCGVVLQVPDENAGKKGKCPKCGILFTIPYASAGEPAPHAPAPAPAYVPPPAPAYAPPPAPAYTPPPAAAYVPPPTQAYASPEPPLPAVAPAPAAPIASAIPAVAGKKPFLLVWVVFFWVITALALMFAGASLMGSISAFMSESSFRHSARSLDAEELVFSTSSKVELIGGLVFHLGLFTLAVCYGLWTARPWTVIAGRVLSLVFVALSVTGLVFGIINHVFIVTFVFAVVACGLIAAYLFATNPFKGRTA